VGKSFSYVKPSKTLSASGEKVGTPSSKYWGKDKDKEKEKEKARVFVDTTGEKVV